MADLRISTEPLHIQTLKIADHKGSSPWTESILIDEQSSLALRADLPGGQGGSVDNHIHHDFVEWWIVLEGELKFEIGDYPPIIARQHDIVTSPLGTHHLITTTGTKKSIRLIVGYPGSDHSDTKPRGTKTIPFPDEDGPPNLIHTKIDQLMLSKGVPPWDEVVVDNEHVKATLIYHAQGMANRPHWHPDENEWWLLLKGEVSYHYSENREPFLMKEGDVVFMPKGFRHELTTISDEPSLRLAVGTSKEHLIYYDDDNDVPPPRR